MKILIQLLVVLSLFMMSIPVPGAHAGTNESPPVLRFLNMEFDPLDGSSNVSKAERRSADTSGRAYYIIQFDGPIRQEWKDALTGMGVVIFDYVPEFAFIIKADTALEDELRALGHVRWLGPYSSGLKMSARVNALTSEELARQGNQAKLTVVAFVGEDVAELQSRMEELGAIVQETVETDWDITFVVLVPVRQVHSLAAISGIKWVEPVREHKLHNNIGTDIMQVRGVREKTWTISGDKLFGEGQIVGICDSGIDTGVSGTLHEDFNDGNGASRMIFNEVLPNSSLTDASGHGTHVAGSVLGNGARSGADPANDTFPDSSYAGVAPKARFYFQSVGPSDGGGYLPGIPSNLNTLFQPAYDAGARIHTNSWGGSFRADYTSNSVNVDQFMWANKDFLVLFAAGNAGSDRNLDGVIDSHTVDAPGTAKNCLTVGASENLRATGGYADDRWGMGSWGWKYPLEPIASDLTSDKPVGLAAFSSRGPTVSGRYKPEIVAPGTNILSTRSTQQLGNGWGAFNDYYYYSGGTSMATPLTAGAAALLREYLMDEEGIVSPSAALLKTALIHGATDLTPGQYGGGTTQEIHAAPHISQGWGRVNLENSVNYDPRKTVEYNDVTSSAPADSTYSRSFTFAVADDGAPFRTTLGWTDYPGSTTTIGALVNDLDLRVRKPDGTYVYPDNALNLGTVEKHNYASSYEENFGDGAIGIRFTPSSYPQLLDSIWLSVDNRDNDTTPISLVVYEWTGTAVGNELYRQEIGYLPPSTHLLPIGLTVASGSVVVAVELGASSMTIDAETGNASGRAFANLTGQWEAASSTPFIEGIFRAEVPATDYDRVNNTVSVTIDDPVPGAYTAEVAAYNIPNGPQPYALVMSGLTTAIETSGASSVETNAGQPDAPTVAVTSTTRTAMDASQIQASHGILLHSVEGDVVEFSGTITGNYGQGLVSMRYGITGLPARTAGSINLTKLVSWGVSRNFSYPKFEDYADGNWWLTDGSGAFIDPEITLDPAATYYVVSVVKDNGPYDANLALNVVEDPQVLSGSGVMGAGGGGCTVGSEGDMATTLLVAVACLALLRRRRRN